MTEQEKYLEWHKREQANGLIDIKFYVSDGSLDIDATAEDFFREANRTNELYEAGNIIKRDDVF